MNPTILGVVGLGFLNQVPTLGSRGWGLGVEGSGLALLYTRHLHARPGFGKTARITSASLVAQLICSGHQNIDTLVPKP